MKRDGLICAVIAAFSGAVAAWGVARVCVAPRDPAEAYLAENRRTVERLVLEDIGRYGLDVYRLYMEATQRLPGMPDDDFGADKAFRKLQVTYPGSHAFRFAEAVTVYGAIRKRDVMQMESYLSRYENAESRGPRLMPNGYEIVPQLVAAQYNYNFHVGRLAEAAKTLNYLETAFPKSWLFQPQGKPVAVSDFVATQRRILEIVREREAK